MKASSSPSLFRRVSRLALALGALASATVALGQFPAKLDDFAQSDLSSIGAPRIVIDDATVGGKSHLTHNVKDGVLTATGEIKPARGQPGFVSLVLPMAAPNEAADLSHFEGIVMRVKLTSGNLAVSANSTEVVNFDYHAAPITRAADGDFHEIKIPFASMKRAWSEQTKLNPATINSISLVVAGVQPGDFAYAIDEIGFY
ncbi:CIA30 family protein [Actomonas aquatica]|uniref:CIA30 family protein n=1 Tax=Actomonas aquatica TaxID=2866162 RepID=A0ABZ1C7U3_9BACT|nr:CIA30 family protein [Opitutus sp. WL0086]WRQ87513.1 CIA30 family protein [Opitutus sp. WL0086]